jgi:NTP pyrophosphatase (non-canonical NTP hydrolase)
MSPSDGSLKDITAELRQFVEERAWGRFHDSKNLSMLLASEAGELLAEFRWVANREADKHAQIAPQRERIEHELGDVGIALLLLCDRLGIDLVIAIRNKIALNRTNYPVNEAYGKAER